MDEQDADNADPLSKSEKKSQGLYNMLIKKKRIGCLQGDSNSGREGVPKESCKSNNSISICNFSRFSTKDNNTTLTNSKSSKLDTNTNVALCCAMTENSNTPLHKQVDGLSSREMLASAKAGKKKLLQRMNGIKSDDAGNELTTKVSCLPKPSSVTDLVYKGDRQRKISVEGKKTSHRRSFSLSKTGLTLMENNENEKNTEDKSVESNPSGEISPESTSSPVVSHISVRHRFLLSQRSVDNIMVPSPGSSPVSTRSVPGIGLGKKKKNRPVSLMVLSRNPESQDRNRAPSMDSLARNSLLAAQVLHLIPANKARERNYLHGRAGANSLLGNAELDRVLPKREIRIYIATWNMNGQAPPPGLNPLLLPDGVEHVPDIVAVGTQESYPERFQWEVTLQETLGPSHVLFHSAAFGTIHLAIFIRRDLIWFCSVAEEASYSVRPGTAFRTKGALGVAFYLFGTSFIFITCHLTAHQEKVKERLQDIRKIVKSLELPKILPSNRHRGKDVTDNFDYVLWCGDLNFRLSRPRTEVLSWVSQHSFPLPQPPQFTPDDQLTNSLINGSVLRGFQEGPITFAPTYKYDPGTQNFDTSNKQRTPSYTDRILFKSRRGGSEALECLEYKSVPSVCTSDHKPVWGLYKCPVRPGIDTIPLAAGLFNREVYLEAIKRRAAAMDQREDSTVCSIQ